MEFRLALFAHVLSAMGLFAALALEWASLRLLRAASSFEKARDGGRLLQTLKPLGIPATLIALASGIYLATSTGLWELTWVKVAVPVLVLVAIAGAIVGVRRDRIVAALRESHGELPKELRSDLQDPMLVASWRFRAALLTGLVFEMSAKPDTGIVVIGGFAMAGLLWALMVRPAKAPNVEVAP